MRAEATNQAPTYQTRGHQFCNKTSTKVACLVGALLFGAFSVAAYFFSTQAAVVSFATIGGLLLVAFSATCLSNLVHRTAPPSRTPPRVPSTPPTPKRRTRVGNTPAPHMGLVFPTPSPDR